MRKHEGGSSLQQAHEGWNIQHIQGEQSYGQEVIATDAVLLIAQAVEQLLQSDMRHIQLHGRLIGTSGPFRAKGALQRPASFTWHANHLVVGSELKQIQLGDLTITICICAVEHLPSQVLKVLHSRCTGRCYTIGAGIPLHGSLHYVSLHLADSGLALLLLDLEEACNHRKHFRCRSAVA